MEESLSDQAREEEKASLESERDNLKDKIEKADGGEEDKARLEEVERQLANLG